MNHPVVSVGRPGGFEVVENELAVEVAAADFVKPTDSKNITEGKGRTSAVYSPEASAGLGDPCPCRNDALANASGS